MKLLGVSGSSSVSLAAFVIAAGALVAASCTGSSSPTKASCNPNLCPVATQGSHYSCDTGNCVLVSDGGSSNSSCSTTTLQSLVQQDLNACSGSLLATEGVPCINADTQLSN